MIRTPRRKQMSKMILGLVLTLTLGCGVKGPPEPPLPTEGSLKKELQQQQQTVPAQPETPPAPPKTSKKTSKTKAAKTGAPKTTDQ